MLVTWASDIEPWFKSKEISEFIRASSVLRSGVLQAGDRILSISGIRTEFMSSEDFQRALCESGTSVRMEIEFDVTGRQVLYQ